jgi:hypothetical protein
MMGNLAGIGFLTMLDCSMCATTEDIDFSDKPPCAPCCKGDIGWRFVA